MKLFFRKYGDGPPLVILHGLYGSSDTWKINASAILNNLQEMIVGFSRPADNEQGITGFPVVFLKGERSAYLNPGDFRDILKLFPAAEFRVVKDAGHWIHADNPEAVAEALRDLMK